MQFSYITHTEWNALVAQRDQLMESRDELLDILEAIGSEARDQDRDGNIVISSHVWDLVSAALVKAGK